MFDMFKIAGKVKELQEKMKEAQGELDTIQVEAESGGGMLKVTINGNKQLVGLEIEESLITVEEQDVLKDLIIAAINKALKDIEVKIKEHISKSTSEVMSDMPNIPGVDFSSFV